MYSMFRRDTQVFGTLHHCNHARSSFNIHVVFVIGFGTEQGLFMRMQLFRFVGNFFKALAKTCAISSREVATLVSIRTVHLRSISPWRCTIQRQSWGGERRVTRKVFMLIFGSFRGRPLWCARRCCVLAARAVCLL